MIAEHYDAELADTIYQDVYFSISGDQFADDADLTHEVDGRIHEEDEVRAKALELAERFGHAVEVSVYGTWGHYGNEYIESLKVQPTLTRLLQNVSGDLAALGI